MAFDGLAREAEMLGDLLGGVGLCDELDDLEFARGERVGRQLAWPTSSCSSRAIRTRSLSCAARARRALSRRSASSRSSISSTAAATSRTSGSAASRARRPGASGSTRRANAASAPSGRRARRSSAMSMTSISASPPASTSSSSSATGKLTVAGVSTRTSVAASRTAALPANTLQSSGIVLSLEAARPMGSDPGAGVGARAHG